MPRHWSSSSLSLCFIRSHRRRRYHRHYVPALRRLPALVVGSLSHQKSPPQQSSSSSSSSSCRTLLTSVVQDIPLHVPERPVSLVLVEDGVVWKDSNATTTTTKTLSSWISSWKDRWPQTWGVPFAAFEPTIPDDYEGCFGAALQELQSDLTSSSNSVSTFGSHHVVLVTRGPLASWMAQMYLEDLPVAGLVMVNPILLDTDEGLAALHHVSSSSSSSSSLWYPLWKDYTEHWGHWTLQLEPGSVPMLLVYESEEHEEETQSDEESSPGRRALAYATAARHAMDNDVVDTKSMSLDHDYDHPQLVLSSLSSILVQQQRKQQQQSPTHCSDHDPNYEQEDPPNHIVLLDYIHQWICERVL